MTTTAERIRDALQALEADSAALAELRLVLDRHRRDTDVTELPPGAMGIRTGRRETDAEVIERLADHQRRLVEPGTTATEQAATPTVTFAMRDYTYLTAVVGLLRDWHDRPPHPEWRCNLCRWVIRTRPAAHAPDCELARLFREGEAMLTVNP